MLLEQRLLVRSAGKPVYFTLALPQVPSSALAPENALQDELQSNSSTNSGCMSCPWVGSHLVHCHITETHSQLKKHLQQS